MAKIIRKKTEIEAVEDIDDTKGESNFENIPHEFFIYVPTEMDFFCDKIKTHHKSDETSDDERRENKDDAAEVFFSMSRSNISNYPVESYES